MQANRNWWVTTEATHGETGLACVSPERVELPVTDIPVPWMHPWGMVIGLEYPADRPRVVDLVLSNGLRTAETRTARYASRNGERWDLARFVA